MQFCQAKLLCVGEGACSDPGTPFHGSQIATSYNEGQIVRYNCTQPRFKPENEAIICLRIGNTQTFGWFVFDLETRTPGDAVNTSNSGIRPQCLGEFTQYSLCSKRSAIQCSCKFGRNFNRCCIKLYITISPIKYRNNATLSYTRIYPFLLVVALAWNSLSFWGVAVVCKSIDTRASSAR